MNLRDWIDTLTKLATDGWPIVVLILGLIALIVFAKPLRKRLGQLKRVVILGSSLEFETLEEKATATLENPTRETVEDLIKRAANAGWMLGWRGGLPEPPELKITWKGNQATIQPAEKTKAALAESFPQRSRELVIKRRMERNREQMGDTE